MNADDARILTQKIYTRLNARRPAIETAEAYYNGKQPLSFATAEWKKANAVRYAGFSDNWCASVVNAEAERVMVNGISMQEPEQDSWLWDRWNYNDMDAQSSQGFVTTLTTGRSFVIVWGDADGEPVVTWEHPANVEIQYDWENPRLRTAAIKTWVDESIEYATLYTPDAIWKWQRNRSRTPNPNESQADQSRTGYSFDGGWRPRDGVDVYKVNPLGVVPVVEIQNRPTLLGNPVSEIAGVMPMQDTINLLWAYLLLAADYASMPARVLLGAEPPKMPILDKDGTVIGSRPIEMKDLAEKRLFVATGDSAKIDSWEAARLDVFTDTIEIAVGHIAAQTRTPPHYLVTNKGISNLSGDALKSSEIGLTKKTEDFIRFARPELREVFRLMALVKGDDALAMQVRLATVGFQNPEIRSESQMADALLKKSQIGYPFEYLLKEDGKSPSEIEQIMQMKQAEMDSALGAGVQAAVQDAVNNGGSVPVRPAASGGANGAGG